MCYPGDPPVVGTRDSFAMEPRIQLEAANLGRYDKRTRMISVGVMPVTLGRAVTKGTR